MPSRHSCFYGGGTFLSLPSKGDRQLHFLSPPIIILHREHKILSSSSSTPIHAACLHGGEEHGQSDGNITIDCNCLCISAYFTP